ncbi:MAG: SGNH/GDSL hydrolase family protein [Planctomycetes bacterium]|nr:SGNH/GDSL hydrolase family protein [Planctomycetota bacterium]
MRLAVVLCFSLLFTACPSSPPPPALKDAPSASAAPVAPAATPAASPTAPIRYLALGDSYTIGQSVAPAKRWPVQLAVLLRTSGLSVAEPEIVARTGWTTGDLLAGLERAAPKGPYDLVTLLIGVNNQFRGLDAEAYRKELRVLLGRAIELAGGRADRVVVLSTPDWGVTPFAARYDPAKVAAEIDAFNRIEEQEALAFSVAWVDVTPISRRADVDAGLVAPDGLHPSGQMYGEWAKAALPSVRRALGR